MAALKCRVNLSDEERNGLAQKIRRGHESARVLTKARILLKADAGKTGSGISHAKGISCASWSLIKLRVHPGGGQPGSLR